MHVYLDIAATHHDQSSSPMNDKVFEMANPEIENEISVTGIEEADDEPTPRSNSKISPDDFFCKTCFSDSLSNK